MRKDELPWWSKLIIRGFDDDGDGSDDDQNDDDGTDDSSDDDGDQGKPDDLAGLKSALTKERQARKQLEREARKTAKERQALLDKDKSEVERATAAAAAAAEKATRLAARLRETAVDNAVVKLAGKVNFADVDDALRLLDRTKLNITQDEEDPADIEIDEAEIEAALKALAKAKPHLIKTSAGDGEPSASKFGGGRKPTKDDDSDLYDRYPALARSRPRNN